MIEFDKFRWNRIVKFFMMNLCINNIYFELNYQFVNSILWILLLDDFTLLSKKSVSPSFSESKKSVNQFFCDLQLD